MVFQTSEQIWQKVGSYFRNARQKLVSTGSGHGLEKLRKGECSASDKP